MNEDMQVTIEPAIEFAFSTVSQAVEMVELVPLIPTLFAAAMPPRVHMPPGIYKVITGQIVRVVDAPAIVLSGEQVGT